ncbi:ABC-type bacteriocin/lantibiotic exporter [Geosmithia morbida]|uniref:ABC-type bacteriocin/lantibiotic exporter n=1 Tax=Geosmithia morbida TaxID=1094350 RepID=A0A9P4YWP7_9HYPO|nr:ABC-type bacteriocin/lantibiotic exporter [Geosmithia morbida]KAF4123187.1 ABC-type bacteriocin/lantibiotic exporter [Geosmithia morbida]
MDASSEQRVLHSTGSLTGYRPLRQLGSGYLEATTEFEQPFCGNKEGWGPLSPFRYDFTPCFIDVWVAIVAVGGLVLGAGAVWLLSKQRPLVADIKTPRFWVKQTLLAVVIADVVVQLGLQIISYGSIALGDFRTWTTILTIASMGVIFTIQWLEESRMRHAHGVVLFYWLLLIIASAVKLRSLISQQLYADPENLPYFVVYCAGFGLGLAEFLVEWLWPRTLLGADAYAAIDDDEGEECPVEYATIFSRLAFDWMTPMMRRGYKVFLTEADLWGLARSDQTKNTYAAFSEAWGRELKHRPSSPSLWLTLARAHGGSYLIAAVFKVGNDLSQYIQPQLLRLLIAFVASYAGNVTEEPVIKGAAIALAMFGCASFQTVMIHQYFQRSFETGMRIKGSLASSIYRKSLKLSNEGRSSKTTGDIVNYMAVDAQRLQDFTQIGHQIWSAPLQITICMVSLYNLVGWSMMAGIAVMIIMMPIQGFTAKLMKNMQKSQMKNKDARSRLITEIINNMKSIKLYAWGGAFMNKLNHVRNEQELKNLRKIGATQAIANFTWSTAPFFVSCSTFTAFVLTQDRPLTTEIIFPCLGESPAPIDGDAALFNLLTFPLAVLPMVISAMVEASVAAGRITKFLAAEELQSDAVTFKPAPRELGEETVVVRGGSFSWNRHEDKRVLEDIDFTAYKGELSCIVGSVGAGKSSLLQSLIGDLFKEKGTVEVRGTISYASQQTWILNASVKENIVFGYRYDSEFYERTVEACALLDDFAQLPDGDETIVGERGISLSGGQKARVSLARAVYARADIVLLDDILSAVDSHVGKHITEHVLGPRGLLSTKTRILATNAIAVLRQSSYVTLLRDGKIWEKGTYRELAAMKGAVAELLRHAGHEDGSGSSSGSASETSTVIEAPATQTKEELDESEECVPEMEPIKAGASTAGGKPRSSSTATLRRASTASFRGPRGKLTDEEVAGAGAGARSRQNKELVEQGKVKWNVYLEYARENDVVAVCVYLFTMLASQAANMGGSVWLKQWSESNQDSGANTRVGMYIGVYFAFGIGSSLLTVIQTLVLWIFCSIEASRKFHERMANAIFRAPMSFFDTTPAGRILNRFSSDIYKIDEVLARTFNQLLVSTTRSLFTLAVISVSTPAFVGLIVPLVGAYYWIQRYYLRTSRELKRLDSVSRSPIYAHFQESLGGVSTIRAYRQQQRFELENEWRVDANLRAYFPSVSANRWLAMRLEIIGALVILAAAGFSVMSVASGSGLSAGLVGLAMSYALQITTALNWIVRQTVEVETNIVAVERVLEYARLPSEAAEVVPGTRPPVAWPAKGEVDFVNYSTRYREGLDLVLRNVSLDIRSHEKIGVVGRTGAGKSSLTLALFRLIEPRTLRSPLFANRTIITVAHRLNTILDSDRVVVLDKGEVAEFDTPKALYAKQGIFYNLMKQAGLEMDSPSSAQLTTADTAQTQDGQE